MTVLAKGKGLESLKPAFKAVEFERALTQRASMQKAQVHYAHGYVVSNAQERRESALRASKAPRRG